MVTKVTAACIIKKLVTQKAKISVQYPLPLLMLHEQNKRVQINDKMYSNLISFAVIIGLETRGLYCLEKCISILN